MSTNVTLYVESGSATSNKTRAAMDSAGIIYELVPVTADDYPLQAVGTSYPAHRSRSSTAKAGTAIGPT